jgi:DNA-binding transcriptional LysR family regulator
MSTIVFPPVSPTERGAAPYDAPVIVDGRWMPFYQRARNIFGAMDKAEAEVSSRTKAPSGLVRVNVPLSFGISHFAPLWGEFMAVYPQIDLDVRLNDRLVDLVDEGFDLALRISTLPDSLMVSGKLAATEMLACASPDYLARHRIPLHSRDLAQHRVLAIRAFRWKGRVAILWAGRAGRRAYRCAGVLQQP